MGRRGRLKLSQGGRGSLRKGKDMKEIGGVKGRKGIQLADRR